MCATLTSNAESATAMHIHKGAAGINGPVVCLWGQHTGLGQGGVGQLGLSGLSVDDRESCSG